MAIKVEDPNEGGGASFEPAGPEFNKKHRNTIGLVAGIALIVIVALVVKACAG